MKERGILFKAPLVRAILAGTKTQTRRLIKPQPVRQLPTEEPLSSPGGEAWTIRRELGWRWQRSKNWSCYAADGYDFAGNLAEHCPYGRAGELLWVRETWGFDDGVRADFKPSGRHDLSGMDLLEHVVYRACVPAEHEAEELSVRRKHGGAPWRPSLLMPRWASRITLEVTEVRVQRLQDISEEEARAEGVRACDRCDGSGIDPVRVDGADPDWCSTCGGGAQGVTCRDEFERLWDAINGKAAPWASNPWLWCISFKRVEKP